MNCVILQPAGGLEPQKHFNDTIRNPVDLERIRKYIPDQYQLLSDIYPGNGVPTWGVVPGTNDSNVNKWRRMQSGDAVLFTGNKRVFASGVVTHKTHNRDLAVELWGFDKDGQTWEYVYFLDEITYHDIPYAELSKLTGYKPKYDYYGFNVLDEDRSHKVLEAFNLRSEVHLPEVSEEQFKEAVNALEDKDSLEVQGTTELRVEQSYLRKKLFGKRTIAKCGICNKDFPVLFLVAAHIKKRAACSLEEKKDYKSIVMPMCGFGCDYLYEKGYIAVIDGKVCDLKKKLVTPAINRHMSQIINNECSYWNDSSAPYFMWHFNNHRSSS